MRARAADALAAGPSARQAAHEAYEKAIGEVVATQLATMPVARLKETTEGRVRINLVEQAGFRTVDSVLRAGPYRLQQIRGVG